MKKKGLTRDSLYLIHKVLYLRYIPMPAEFSNSTGLN